MGELRDRMQGDLLLKGVAATTRAEYLRCAAQLAAYYPRSPAELGAEDVRQYFFPLVRDLTYSPSNLKLHVAGMKCLYTVTLNRPEVVERIPYPKVPRTLLDIPSPGEVAQVLAAVSSLKYRLLLFCAYGAGLRVGEACTLCTGAIDSQRMVIHVRAGKGGRDRYAMLSPVLLDSLRQYYRQEHPEKPFLFPSATPGKPAPVEGVQTTLRLALAHSGVSKRITPPTLRHAFATHRLESGTDLRVLQVLLGQANLRTTTRYVPVSTKLIASPRSPLAALAPPVAQHAHTPQDQTPS